MLPVLLIDATLRWHSLWCQWCMTCCMLEMSLLIDLLHTWCKYCWWLDASNTQVTLSLMSVLIDLLHAWNAIADWLVACLMQLLLMTYCMLHTSHCWSYQYSGDIQFDAMHIWLVVAFLMPVLLMLATLWWHSVWCQCCMTCCCMLIDGLWWCFHLPSDYTKCW